jgi:hypothetical protein
MAEQSEFEKRWAELQRLHDEAVDLLSSLDRLGLYEAGAYLSMVIDVMRRQHPDLGSSE